MICFREFDVELECMIPNEITLLYPRLVLFEWFFNRFKSSTSGLDHWYTSSNRSFDRSWKINDSYQPFLRIPFHHPMPPLAAAVSIPSNSS
jgi:hypothetical protein